MGALDDQLNKLYRIRLGLCQSSSERSVLLECSGDWVVADPNDCLYCPLIGDLVLFVLIDQKVYIIKKFLGGK